MSKLYWSVFFIMHVLPCKSKFDLFTALLRLDYEASYGWLAFVLHIDSIILCIAERYDPREGFWALLPSMSVRRGSH